MIFFSKYTTPLNKNCREMFVFKSYAKQQNHSKWKEQKSIYYGRHHLIFLRGILHFSYLFHLYTCPFKRASHTCLFCRVLAFEFFFLFFLDNLWINMKVYFFESRILQPNSSKNKPLNFNVKNFCFRESISETMCVWSAI